MQSILPYLVSVVCALISGLASYFVSRRQTKADIKRLEKQYELDLEKEQEKHKLELERMEVNHRNQIELLQKEAENRLGT